MTIFRGGAVQIPPSPYRRYRMVSSFFMLGTRARRGAKDRPLPGAGEGRSLWREIRNLKLRKGAHK